MYECLSWFKPMNCLSLDGQMKNHLFLQKKSTGNRTLPAYSH